VGFGSELLFLLVLGFLLLGPKKLPAILGSIARAKAQLKKATQSFGDELDVGLEPHSQQPETNVQARPGGHQ
jgi:Sec-independent protein translocase protein TatA